MVDSKLPSKSVFRLTWPLLFWNAVVAFFVSFEFINVLVISNLFWPGEVFHAVEVSLLIGTRLWADGIFAIFWGVLVDKPRINRKKLFSITSSLTALMVLINGWAPIGNGTHSLGSWILIRILIGVFMSAGGPMFNSLSSDSLTPQQRSQFFGLAGLFWTIFQSIGTLTSAYLFLIGFWRQFIWGAGIGFIIWGVLFVLFYQEPKRAAQDSEVKHLIQTTAITYNYEMNIQTLKKTMFSRTNLLILFEGFFTGTVFNMITFLLTPYVLSPPLNLSTISLTLLMFIFGFPGGFIGMVLLAKVSDKYGGNNLHRRIKLIVGSILIGILFYFMIFLIPFPPLTVEQGKDFTFLMGHWEFYWIGLLILGSNAFLSMYGINQSPIVQQINLPEGRGKIASWNQFIEVISAGTGPVIAGIVLLLFGYNYRLTFQILLILIIPGILLWLLALRFIEKDRALISEILQKRAQEMELQLGN